MLKIEVSKLRKSVAETEARQKQLETDLTLLDADVKKKDVELASLKAEVESLKQLCQELKNLKDIPESSKQVVREGEQIPGSKGVQPEDKNESSSGATEPFDSDLHPMKKQKTDHEVMLMNWMPKYQKNENLIIDQNDKGSSEIFQCYSEEKETEEGFTAKLDLINRIDKICKDLFPSSKVFFTGSSCVGIALKDSDVDVVLSIPDENLLMEEILVKLEMLKDEFMKSGCVYAKVAPAAVPIIQAKYGSIDFDLSINNIESV